MHFRQAILNVDRNRYLLQAGKSNSFEEIYADFEAAGLESGTRYTVFLHPKQDLTIRRLEIQFDLPPSEAAWFFSNGFQSWSESRLLGPDEYYPALRSVAHKRLGHYGDEHIPDIPRAKGYRHSWTYTYLSAGPDPANSPRRFLGSLNESTGFTLFLYDRPNGILTVRKDMDGLRLSHSFPALDFWTGEGGETDLFDRWQALLGLGSPAALPAVGWTSWYRHFADISETIILENLETFSAFFPPENPQHRATAGPACFQIDDGWQTKVGDWLSVKSAFPNGMASMAQKIRQRGLLPGLWLAPFAVAADSDLARRRPEWLLRDAGGKALRAGWNPVWGGWYHALDFYNNDVRNHLGGIFHTILEQWGYGMVKLDFLFAACLAPPPGKTRGQVMCEAMEFLRKLAGNRKILACGVPLGAAIGLADYCRIGGDIHLAWEHRLLAFLRMRERVSTLASLRSTLGRWQLDGRLFRNDPDVFILRDDHQRLTPEQQQTVLTVNALLGGLLFTSDDLGRYTPEQQSELAAALELRGSRTESVSVIEKDLYRIVFTNSETRYAAYCNLNARKRTVQIRADGLELLPFETVVLEWRVVSGE